MEITIGIWIIPAIFTIIFLALAIKFTDMDTSSAYGFGMIFNVIEWLFFIALSLIIWVIYLAIF